MQKTIAAVLVAGLVATVAYSEETAPAAAPAAPAASSAARRSCEDLKAEIGAKLDVKGVKGYTLSIVTPEEAGDAKVVGSCDAGTHRIVYKRG